MENKIIKVYSNPEEDFTIEFSYDKPADDMPYWLDFKVWEVAGTESDGNLMYHSENDFTIDYHESDEQLCSGFIKWDGCMELHNLNIHLCGWEPILERLVRDIYLQAQEIMGDRFDEDLAQLKYYKNYYAGRTKE